MSSADLLFSTPPMHALSSSSTGRPPDELTYWQNRIAWSIAQDDVRRTVGAMAEAVGAQLAANVLGLDPAEVRRFVKSNLLPTC